MTVAPTARGRVQARVLGAQLANVPVELAVGTRLLRTRQTIDIALHGRQIPVLIEPGFDELQAGDVDGAPIQVYRSWKHLHAPDSRFPQGESPADALRRHANALRRLLASGKPTEGIWSLTKRSMANFAAADLNSLVRLVKRKLKKIQCRLHLINGCLAATGFRIEPW